MLICVFIVTWAVIQLLTDMMQKLMPESPRFMNYFVSVMGWIAYVNSLKKTLRNFLVIYALFDVWCGWGLGGAAASLPGFAVKNSKTGLRGGCASMTWPISQIFWYIFMYMAMSWYAFQVLVLIFTFFPLNLFFPCTFFVCLSPFSYCTTVICNMATNKWYIYIYICLEQSSEFPPHNIMLPIVFCDMPDQYW